MLFSENTLKMLKDCAQNQTLVEVCGKNAQGKAFCSQGIVLSDGLNSNTIRLFMGQYGFINNRPEKLFIRLNCQFDYNLPDPTMMYIQNIKDAQTGETIFSNNNFEQILAESVELQRSHRQTGWYLDLPLSESAQKIAEQIGKPTILLKKTPIIVRNVYVDTLGFIYVDVTSGYQSFSLPYADKSDIKPDKQALEILNSFAAGPLSK